MNAANHHIRMEADNVVSKYRNASNGTRAPFGD